MVVVQPRGAFGMVVLLVLGVGVGVGGGVGLVVGGVWLVV